MNTANTTEFLKDQIQDAERWKIDHEPALRCMELEDCIREGLALFGMVNGFDEQWSRAVQEGKKPFDETTARDIHNAYAAWLKPCPYVFRWIAATEDQGFEVEGADELRRAYRLCRRLQLIDIEGLIESMRELRAA